MVGAFRWPHFEHLTIVSGAPQLPQNFSVPTGLPHCGQAVGRLLVSPLKTLHVSYVSAAKLASIFKPTAWLFSGWNCRPNSRSRPTIEANETP